MPLTPKSSGLEMCLLLGNGFRGAGKGESGEEGGEA